MQSAAQVIESRLIAALAHVGMSPCDGWTTLYWVSPEVLEWHGGEEMIHTGNVV